MKQVLCFGDSNTWGLIPGGGRYRWGERWTSILQEKMEPLDVRVIEEGLCGRTTVFHDELRSGKCGATALPMLLESHWPLDVIVLMLGTNDCKTYFNASAEIIGKGIEKLLSIIGQYSGTSKVLIVSPIHLGDRVYEEEFDPEFNEHSVEVSKKLKKVYEKTARMHGAEFLAASDYVEPSKVDMEHLDKESHAILAEVIYQKLLSMFQTEELVG